MFAREGSQSWISLWSSAPGAGSALMLSEEFVQFPLIPSCFLSQPRATSLFVVGLPLCLILHQVLCAFSYTGCPSSFGRWLHRSHPITSAASWQGDAVVQNPAVPDGQEENDSHWRDQWRCFLHISIVFQQNSAVWSFFIVAKNLHGLL